MRFAMYPIVRAFTSIAVSAMLLFAHTQAQAADPAEAVVGFQDSTGKTVFLHDFKGKPVLINLWATWCAPCILELPSLVKMQQAYAAKGLVVIALSEDDTADLPISFLKLKGYPDLPSYFDPGHAVYIALTAAGLPTTILVDRNGKMVHRIQGPVDWMSPKVTAIIDTLVK